jgi:hypothetical protein
MQKKRCLVVCNYSRRNLVKETHRNLSDTIWRRHCKRTKRIRTLHGFRIRLTFAGFDGVNLRKKILCIMKTNYRGNGRMSIYTVRIHCNIWMWWGTIGRHNVLQFKIYMGTVTITNQKVKLQKLKEDV